MPFRRAFLPLLAAGCTALTAGTVSHQVILSEGDPAPGTGSNFTELFIPAINAQGKVVVGGQISFISGGIWVWSPESLDVLAHTGQPAPGLPDVTLGGFTTGWAAEQILAPDGQAMFWIEVSGTGITPINNRAFYLGTPGNLQLIMQKGEEAPGHPGKGFNDADYTFYLRDGSTFVFAGQAGPPSASNVGRGYWGGALGNLTFLGGTGTETGMGPLEDVDQRHFSLSPDGSVYTPAILAGNHGVWRLSAAGAQRLVEEGESAPGTGMNFGRNNGGTGFHNLQAFATNRFFFNGYVDSTPISQFATGHVHQSGASTFVYMESANAPGLPHPVRHVAETLFNEGGGFTVLMELEMGAGVDFSNDRVLYYGAPGTAPVEWKTIFRKGDPAPGLPGLSFGDTLNDEVCINRNGLVFFLNRLQPGAPPVGTESLWIYDPAEDDLTLVAQAAVATNFGDGVLRTPESFAIRGGSGSAAGSVSSLNDSNQITFRADEGFADPSTLILSEYTNPPAAIPYPDWATDQGLTAVNNGVSDDPNLDGISNFAAYVLGVPALGETGGDGISVSLNAARDSLLLRFSTPNYVTGVTIGSQVSGDLQSWQAGPDPVEVDATDETTLFELAIPLEDQSGFARLTFDN